MKILIVGDIPPSPNIMGNQKFLISHMRLLKSMGYCVSYLYIDGKIRNTNQKWKFEAKELEDIGMYTYHIPVLRNLIIKIKKKIYNKYYNGKSYVDSYYPYGLATYINKLQKKEKFDICITNYYYISKALTKIKIPIRAFYTHDSFINRASINQCVSPSLSPNEESKALQRAPIIFALQDTEAILFKKLAPASIVKTIYMPLKYTETLKCNNHNLLFFGGKAFFNIEGIKWFINLIWPEIKQRYSDAKLIIGGAICEVLDESLSSQDITLYGRVKDVLEFYELGDIAINPVFHGSGLKIKTLEGIEYNKIVISSFHSAEGIYMRSNAPILLADNLEEWLRNIDLLWNNNNYITQMKYSGVEYINSMNRFIEKEYRSVFKEIN